MFPRGQDACGLAGRGAYAWRSQPPPSWLRGSGSATASVWDKPSEALRSAIATFGWHGGTRTMPRATSITTSMITTTHQAEIRSLRPVHFSSHGSFAIISPSDIQGSMFAVILGANFWPRMWGFAQMSRKFGLEIAAARGPLF